MMIARARHVLRSVELALLRPENLTRVFLATAAAILLAGILVLGEIVSVLVNDSIASGVGSTAAVSLDALISDELHEAGTTAPYSAQKLRSLDQVFLLANNISSTRLMQIRVIGMDGSLLYESSGGLIDRAPDSETVERAKQGKITSGLTSVPLSPIGGVPSGNLATLRIVTPLHDSDGRIFAVAELYYGATAVVAIQRSTGFAVGLATLAVGLAALAALYWLVARTRKALLSQRARLLRNLGQSRALARENRSLHLLSEQLRHQANYANEHLLAEVGSDLHDGPIQMLTLLILNLSKPARDESAKIAKSTELARNAMTELRGIVSGLMLPELDDLSLCDAVSLAIARHEKSAGVTVAQDLAVEPVPVTSDIKVCAYRVIQEALMNAFRHGSGDAEVLAFTAAGWLHLTISNPADGMPRHGAGTGLRSMRFRIESLGGQLAFYPTDDGISIIAGIPLNSG